MFFLSPKDGSWLPEATRHCQSTALQFLPFVTFLMATGFYALILLMLIECTLPEPGLSDTASFKPCSLLNITFKDLRFTMLHTSG